MIIQFFKMFMYYVSESKEDNQLLAKRKKNKKNV